MLRRILKQSKGEFHRVVQSYGNWLPIVTSVKSEALVLALALFMMFVFWKKPFWNLVGWNLEYIQCCLKFFLCRSLRVELKYEPHIEDISWKPNVDCWLLFFSIHIKVFQYVKKWTNGDWRCFVIFTYFHFNKFIFRLIANSDFRSVCHGRGRHIFFHGLNEVGTVISYYASLLLQVEKSV